jgi:anti-repressor protein
MNELQVFTNEQFGSIRTAEINGEAWFVGKDIAEALGYTDVNHALLDHVDADDRINSKTQGQNDLELGQRGGWLINESGVYALVFGSKLPTAKQFKHWVTSEVLPTIRKHGAYVTPVTIDKIIADPAFGIKLLTELQDEREKRAALESRVEEDRPKVLFASAVETAKTSILVGELAKVLRQNGVEIGQNRLFKWLRDKGYLIRRSGTDFNMPTQRSMDLGLFEIKETAITRGDGTVHVSKTPKVTGKGQVYFCNAFLNKGD